MVEYAIRRRRLVGGAVGTFVEWYDFLIYGLSAPVLALHFFPESNPTAALLGTFAIYAVAFFIRPVGGVFFGYLSDRGGRIGILAITILLMGAATVGTGLLPTYADIGLAAPALLLVCRLAQGFSAGGETSGGLSYVLESAPPEHRARWVGIGVASSFLPVVVGGVLILGLRAGLGEDTYTSWAWRIPFFVGGVVAVVGLWLRRKLDDPEEFTEAIEEEPAPNPVRSALTTNRRWIGIVVILVAIQAVGAYLLNGYMYSYLVNQIGMDGTAAMGANSIAIASIVVLLPTFGSVADRVGRKPLMWLGAAWLLVFSWPALALAETGSFFGALAGQLLLAIGVALFASGGFVTMVELFQTSIRFTGHAISYNLGYAIFGGTTPLIAASLVGWTGSTMAPAYYVMAISVLGAVIVVLTPETRGRNLKTAIQRRSAAAGSVATTEGVAS